MRSLKIGLGLAFMFSLGSVALASYPYTIDSSVSVCDPKAPASCVKPNVDGSINVVTSPSGSTTANQGTPGPVTAGWPIVAGEPVDTTGTFTNATQTTAIATTPVDGYQTATITIKGTYGTATATFLASDDAGVTYYPIQCARTDGSAAELGYTALSNTSRAWYCPMHGFDSIEVLSSAVASGTVNVHISISAFSTAFGGINVSQPAPPIAGSGIVQSCYLTIKATATACGSAAAKNLIGWDIGNVDNTAVGYVQLFNLAAGSVTLGTTVPTKTIALSASGGNNFPATFPVSYSTALTAACTTTATGLTAPTNNCTITLYYTN